ncbi:MAG: hypothetical protein ACOH1R_08645 [Luteimonas sp.]
MTFTSVELIEALRRRTRKSLRPEQAADGFPPGWVAWFSAMRERVGAVTGASADAIIAIFLAREPKLPPRAGPELNGWQSFTTLWRQQWQPASADERGLRIVGSVVTLLVHLLLAIFLVYVAYVRFMGIPQPAPEGEEVIQVEYIGDGTPDEEGGGAPQAELNLQVVPEAASAKATASPAPVQQVAQQPPTPQAAPASSTEAATTPPAQSTPAPPVDQPLQVTEKAAPDAIFTLPPVRMVEIPALKMDTPDLGAPAPAIKVADVPSPKPRVTLPDIAPRAIATPQLKRLPTEVAVRDIPAPLARVQLHDVPAMATPTPQLKVSAPTIATRDIPMPPGASAPTQGSATSAAQPASGTSHAASAKPAGGAKIAGTGTQAARSATGGGKTASPRPGAVPSPKRGDDWGASDRNRPGGQAGKPGGLFNADGTPKLAAGDGKIGGGLPPGTITEDFAKIDRNGTWLKRPPTDYAPTSFDKFWVPSETLLQEWVRRSIKEVLIPIPGTSKSIKCSVVLLALGGACGITDPNLQDVEATARKPPDIPFKPELQEDQGSLAKPAVTP